MSDLRDFTADSAPRFVDSPSVINEPIRDDVVFVDDGGLSDLHISPDRVEEGAGRSKLFAGLAVAVAFGAAGAFAWSQFTSHPVADKEIAAVSAPARTAAMAPPPAPLPAAQETATTPAPEATAPAAPDVVKPAPVTKQAAITNAPRVMPAPQSSIPALPPPSEQYTAPAVTAPAQNQASNMPEPVSPAPPASALAGNPALNEQSAQPDAPAPAAAQPEPAPAAPAEPVPAQ